MAPNSKRPRPAPSTRSATNHREGDSEKADDAPDVTPLDRISIELAELREYARYYLEARRDILKLLLRRIAAGLLLILLGPVAVLGAIVAAIWLLLTGLAGGLGEWFGNRLWLGNLTVGCLVIASVALGTWLAVIWWRVRWRERTVERYEQRQDDQRARFGRDVAEQATASAKE
jgi:hypothetical protein